MARSNTKPYQRESRRENPDTVTSWKHDLHESSGAASGSSTTSANSLFNRLSGTSSSSSSSTPTSGSSNSRRAGNNGNSNRSGGGPGASLLSRMSGGKGKELLSTTSTVSSSTSQSKHQPKLHGFSDTPPSNPFKLNSGIELLPPSGTRSGGGSGSITLDRRNGGSGVIRGMKDNRIVNTSLEAALGLGNHNINGRQNQLRQIVVYPQPSPVELLPSYPTPPGSSGFSQGGSVQNQNQLQYQPQPQNIQREGVSIFGAARGSTWIRVEGLALGTTAEDVVSAFSPLPILSATLSPIQPTNSVSVDLEFATKQPAEEAIKQYDGAVADGGTLKVGIFKPLAGRLGGGGASAGAGVGSGLEIGGGDSATGGSGSLIGRFGNQSRPISAAATPIAPASGGTRELLPSGGSSKLYSDSILATNPRTAVITLADEATSSRPAYNNWGGSLVGRVGR